jgi:hypothetical protein
MPSMAMPVNASQLAWAMAYREKNPQINAYGFADRFRVGRTRTIKIDITFPGVGVMTRGTVLDEVDNTTQEMKLADLPASFRQRLEEALVEARKHVTFDPGGTGVKPP